MYYGQDGNDNDTACRYPCGSTFYIGALGAGSTAGGQPYSSYLASQGSFVYAYWVLLGPAYTPAGSTDFQWGQAQAVAANSAYVNALCRVSCPRL